MLRSFSVWLAGMRVSLNIALNVECLSSLGGCVSVTCASDSVCAIMVAQLLLHSGTVADFVDQIIAKGTATPPPSDKNGVLDYDAMCKQAESLATIAETLLVESSAPDDTQPGDPKADCLIALCSFCFIRICLKTCNCNAQDDHVYHLCPKPLHPHSVCMPVCPD